ncbi:MAG: hypothetical protein IPL04_05640 [Chitinophagaceae bacterium]|nr:hypothetical protein [Chitinophagaceae bacterium]
METDECKCAYTILRLISTNVPPLAGIRNVTVAFIFFDNSSTSLSPIPLMDEEFSWDESV